MFKSINKKLSSQLTLTIASFMLLLAIALLFYLARSEQSSLLQQADIQGQSISKITALAIVEPVLEDDYPVLSSYAQALILSNPSIIRVTVYDRDGKRIVNQSSAQEEQVPDIYLSVYNADITLEGVDTIGKVSIHTNNEKIYQTIAHRIKLLSATLFVAILTAVILLRWVLKRIVIQPLKILSKGADLIAAGDLGHQIEMNTNNEYAEVSERFNLMATTLKKTNQEMVEALKQANEANRLKSEFLANMSHEIRTPLNAIVGFSQLLKQCNLNEFEENYVDRINLASDSLCDLINNILDLSKIEADKLSLENIDFDLREILTAIGVLHNDQAAEKGLELILSCPPDLPTHLVGDPTRIKQVLINLVSNAIKFTETGYVHVDVSGKQAKNQLQLSISVTDTGIGLSDSQMRIIFDSFVQADGSTTRNYGGTGLGLSISKRLVDMMKGELIVSNREGEGSVFCFNFCLPISDKTKSVDHASIRLHVLKDLSILVIDDSEEVRTYLRCLLEFYSVKVSLASGGQEAINNVKQNPGRYDLIILDWMMPGINGLTTAKILKRDAEIENIPIIMATAFDDEEVWSNQGQYNIKACVFKPLIESKLISTIAQIVDPIPTTSKEQNPLVEKKTALIDSVLKNKRCLVVDDNLFNRELASELVTGLGLTVNTAENGKLALEALDTEANKGQFYDIVLMDMQMPVMDGYEAMRRIKANEKLAHIPIIAITANALMEDKEKCIKAGADDYLPKPLDIELLETKLYQWISNDTDAPVEPIQKKEATDNTQTEVNSIKNFTLSSTSCVDIQTAVKRMCGRMDIYVKVLKSFYHDEQFSPESLFQVINGSDRDAAKLIIHALKGLAGTIGADNLQAQAVDIEGRIKQGYSLPLELNELTKAHAEVWLFAAKFIADYDT